MRRCKKRLKVWGRQTFNKASSSVRLGSASLDRMLAIANAVITAEQNVVMHEIWAGPLGGIGDFSKN